VIINISKGILFGFLITASGISLACFVMWKHSGLLFAAMVFSVLSMLVLVEEDDDEDVSQ